MNEGDVIICIDSDDEHYLQVGYVDLLDVEEESAYIKYPDKTTVEYELWRMEGCFRRFVTERLRIS